MWQGGRLGWDVAVRYMAYRVGYLCGRRERRIWDLCIVENFRVVLARGHSRHYIRILVCNDTGRHAVFAQNR
jgi:hypothetical protein